MHSFFVTHRHRTIKMKPNEVTHENEQKLLDTVYKYKRVYSKRRMAKFKVGDYVRLSEYRTVFDKSYTPNWTTAIFRVAKVQYNTDPITYLLKDWEDLEILGSVYAEEIQHVRNANTYLIEKILRRRNGSALVKWLGFSEEYNSWVPESTLAD